MKTVAEFKRRLTVGVLLHCIYHQANNGRDEKGEMKYKDEDKGVREVSIVKSTQFALKTTNSDGKVVDSWSEFPKASKCRIVNDNTIQFLEEDWRIREGVKPLIPSRTYTFVDSLS